MNVLIYGGGAVGLGIAGFLLQAGADTDIIARKNTSDVCKKERLGISGIFGGYTAEASEFGCFTELSECMRTYTHILICTKSFDSDSAAEDIFKNRKVLSDDGIIVLFQNGWGNAEKFREYFPEEKIYNARIITGFIRTRPNHVKVTVHADSVHIGSLFGCKSLPVKELSTCINKGGLPCITTDTIEKDLWAKMLYNCALNPLGAVLKVPYGKLGETEQTREIMEQIIIEIYSVMDKAGYSTYTGTAGEYIELFYNKLLPPTKEHESSMLQDLRAGKKTEIEGLCGAVINLAEKNDLEVPYNRIMHNLIKAME